MKTTLGKKQLRNTTDQEILIYAYHKGYLFKAEDCEKLRYNPISLLYDYRETLATAFDDYIRAYEH